MKFVLYEVWTTARVIEAKSEEDAYFQAPTPCGPALFLGSSPIP